MKLKEILVNKKLFLNKFLLIAALFLICLSFVFLINEIKKAENYIGFLNRIYSLNDFYSYQKETPYLIPLWEDLKKKMIINEYDFVEIDMEERKTRIYKNGNLEDEFLIQAIGNPLNWGGTPVGVYDVLGKYGSAFSNSVEAHMPYAIQFYGKYFIHGEPYYSGGQRIISTYSGGCIRYSNENARKIFDFIKDDTLIFIVDKKRDDFDYNKINPPALPDVSAESFFVADMDSGTVLLEKNSNKKMPIASITKLMNAVVVSENIGLNRSILVTDEMLEYYNNYGETPEIKTGVRYQLIELLYPLLSRSSNQSAEILSRFLGKEKTIEMMNDKAKSIKMRKTSFADTSGLSSDNISTANDLFYLGRYLFNNFKPILSITKSKRAPKIQYLRFNLNELENRNIFIYDPEFMGGKTGFTNYSKNTALFIFKIPYSENINRNIVIILLKSEGLKKDTQAIYSWLLKTYFNN